MSTGIPRDVMAALPSRGEFELLLDELERLLIAGMLPPALGARLAEVIGCAATIRAVIVVEPRPYVGKPS